MEKLTYLILYNYLNKNETNASSAIVSPPLKQIISNETIMSILFTNRDEYVHDSFITAKKQTE